MRTRNGFLLALGAILLCAPVAAQYSWTPSISLVDNTVWCESNNCYTSIGGSVNVVSAGIDGTVYGIDDTSGSRLLSSWTRSAGWVEAASGLQMGGNSLSVISAASATQAVMITTAAYPAANVYVLNSSGTGWTGPIGTWWCQRISMSADGTIICVGGDSNPYRWTGSSWSFLGSWTPDNLANISVASANLVYAVDTSQRLWQWNGTGAVQISTPGFTPASSAQSGAVVSAAGGASLAVLDSNYVVHVSTNGGGTWAALNEGTSVCGVSGGGSGILVFALGCNKTVYHINLQVPAVTTAVTGSYATWCSATSGTEELCSGAVHTISANAHFGGVGGAHGTAGVTATTQGNPVDTLTAYATEAGTECDPFTEDPDQYSACQAYYSGNAVCSVMGAVGGQDVAPVSYTVQEEGAFTEAKWTGTMTNCRKGLDQLTTCSFQVENWCTAETTPPDNDLTGQSIGDLLLSPPYQFWSVYTGCYRVLTPANQHPPWTCFYSWITVGTTALGLPPANCTHNP